MKGTEEEKKIHEKYLVLGFIRFLLYVWKRNKTYFEIKLEEKRAQNPIS
jgi:hypothetical protein